MMKQILVLCSMVLVSACVNDPTPAVQIPKVLPYEPKDLPMVEPYNPYKPQYALDQSKQQQLPPVENYNIDVLMQKFRFDLIGMGAQVISKDHHAKIIFPNSIVFGTNRNTLKADFKKDLKPFVDTLKMYRDSMIYVVGYTDNSMSVLRSQSISVEQAESFVDYLIKEGIEPNRLLAEGKGVEDPIANNKTKEGRAQNNRIELIVIGLQ